MAACFYLGMGLDRYYRIRLQIVEEYVVFLQFAEREMKYLKREVGEIVKDFTAEKKTQFSTLIRALSAEKSEGKDLKAESPYLRERDKKNIVRAFREITAMDYLNYEGVMKNAIAEGSAMREAAEKAKKEKGELYRKLSILIGIGFLILIV